MSARWRLRRQLRRPAQGQSRRNPAAVPSVPPRFGAAAAPAAPEGFPSAPRFRAAAAPDVFFGVPRFGAAAAPDVFFGAPRFGAAAASVPPDPLAFFLPDCFWPFCSFNLVIGWPFLPCPDTLKPSLPPHLLHICFPPLAASGHRQDLNLKSLGPKTTTLPKRYRGTSPRNVTLVQGPTSVCVCVCVCVCACVCVCVCADARNVL